MIFMNNMDKAIDWILNAKRLVFFGGAGVSTASGIPDFRSSDGIFNIKYKYSPEEILSRTFFNRKPEVFYDFYKSKMIFPHILPNITHKVLVKLEEKGILSSIVTQNIDNLHQKAGSKNVIELHGNSYRNKCMKCKESYGIEYIINSESIPKCPNCGGIIKPEVILYEEPLNQNVIENALDEISHADVIVVAGTSLKVYPAASFLGYYRGSKLIIINDSKTEGDEWADIKVEMRLEEFFKKVDELL